MRVYRALESAVKTGINDALRYRGWVLNNVVAYSQREKMAWAGLGLLTLGVIQAMQGAIAVSGQVLTYSPLGYIVQVERHWWGVSSLAIALMALVAASFLFGAADWTRRLGVFSAGMVAVNQAVVLPQAVWWAIPTLLISMLIVAFLVGIKPVDSAVTERIPLHGGGARGVR